MAAAEDAAQSDELITAQLQMLVAEAGWTHEIDHAAMLHAIGRLAERVGRPVLETMRRHISEFHRGFPARRRWIASLTPACNEPEGWPRKLNWPDVHRPLCLEIVQDIELHRAGRLPDPCRGSPDQWRSRRFPKLQRRARRKGWRRIGCGRDTLHVFWQMKR